MNVPNPRRSSLSPENQQALDTALAMCPEHKRFVETCGNCATRAEWTSALLVSLIDDALKALGSARDAT